MSVLVQSLPHLLRGTVSTLALAAAVLAVGTALGLAVGLLRVLPGRAGTVVGGAVELVRAVPLTATIKAARPIATIINATRTSTRVKPRLGERFRGGCRFNCVSPGDPNWCE